MVQRDTEDTAPAQELAQQVREATRQIAVLANELENLLPCDRYIRHSQVSRAESVAQQAVPRQLYLPVGVNQFCRFTSLA